MKISKLHIKNFRCIDDLVVQFADMNAIVGANNAGKSNILDALYLVLGETWPSIRSIEDSDYRDLDRSKDIEVRVWFDQTVPLKDAFGKPHDSYGIYLKFGHYQRKSGKNIVGDPKVDFVMMDKNGSPLEMVQRRTTGTTPFSEPVRVNSETREAIPMLLIGVERNLDYQLRASRYSLLGRIFKSIEREFLKDPARVKAFEEKIVAATEDLRIESFNSFEKKLAENVVKQIGLKDLKLSFQPFDPMNHYKSLDLKLTERVGGPVLSGASMGAGVQSSIVLSLLQAYHELAGDSAILGLEEPELFLHPHACRYFYRVLSDLSKTVQVIYTTHSAFFLDVKRFEEIIYVRKNNKGNTEAISGIQLKGSKAEGLKTQRKLDYSRQELFFAKKAVLVEGSDDKLVLLKALQIAGIDADREGISVIECGGKPAIPAFTKVVNHFRIPTIVLCDEDPGKPTGPTLTKEIVTALGDIGETLLMTPNLEGIFGLTNKTTPIDWTSLLDGIDSVTKLPSVVQNAIQRITALA